MSVEPNFLVQAQERMQQARESAALAAQMSLQTDRVMLLEQARDYERAGHALLSRAAACRATRQRARELIADVRGLHRSIAGQLNILRAQLRR